MLSCLGQWLSPNPLYYGLYLILFHWDLHHLAGIPLTLLQVVIDLYDSHHPIGPNMWLDLYLVGILYLPSEPIGYMVAPMGLFEV
jgi:hypothetical protein